MFIKSVQKTNGRTNTRYSYLYLVESVRTEKGPRQRLVLNLGDLQIDKARWPALAARIEELLEGTESLFETDRELESHARQAARRIFARRAEQIDATEAERFESVDVGSFEASQPRSLGPEYVCHAMWNDLGFNETLIGAGVSRHVLPLLEALVLGRLIEPGSERATKRWAEEHSALYEMSGAPLRGSLQSWYRGTDVLYACKGELEESLARREEELFAGQETILLYDLTNTYFEGRCEGNRKAAFGRSKEKRNDCKLATLGLIVDGQGFAKYSKLYAGNQYEADTFQGIIGDLERQRRAAEGATVVMDAGIATKENLEWLAERSYRYIVVNRGKPPFAVDYEQMSLIKEQPARGVKIEAKRYEYEGERYVVVRSEGKRQKESAMSSRSEQLLLDRLQYYRSGLEKKHRVKKYARMVEMIGRLKEKYPRAGKLYEIEVVAEQGKTVSAANAIDIRWKRKADRYAEHRDAEGTYILRTNRADLSDEQIWRVYLMLGRIESAFRDMKSHLGLRPNFHQKGRRVDAHMFISILAYHLMHAIEHRLRAAGDRRTWPTIRAVLRTHQRITIEYMSKDEDGSRYHNTVRLSSRIEPEHLEIYTRLGLDGRPLQRQRMGRKTSSDHTEELTTPTAMT